MKRYNLSKEITETNNWIVNMAEDIYSDRLAEIVCNNFVAYARNQFIKKRSALSLDTDIDKYIKSITYKKIADGHYRIYAGYGGDNQLVNDMYYLEFGTGIVGASAPHPLSGKIGWGYNINGHLQGIGWVFRRSKEAGNQDTFIAKGDKVHNYKRNLSAGKIKGGVSGNIRAFAVKAGDEKSIRTFGVKGMRYFYDTMLNFDKILKLSIGELSNE